MSLSPSATMSTLEQVLLGVNGTFVSLVLFAVTYRQTVGARKERAKNANDALSRMVLRRVVQEDYAPRSDDVRALREGYSRDFRVKLSEIFDYDELLTTLFTRISDADFVAAETRNEILERLRNSGRAARRETADVMTQTSRAAERRSLTAFSAFLAILAAAGGTAAVGLPFLGSLGALFSSETLAVFVSSILGIAGLALGRRIRERSGPPEQRETWWSDFEFKNDIRELLRNHGLHPVENRGPAPFDYSVVIGDRRYVIEAEAWFRPRPLLAFRQSIASLKALTRDSDLGEAWFVLPDEASIPSALEIPDKVRLLKRSEVIDHLLELGLPRLRSA